nr:Chain F, DUAL SPECIFICITY MITOGEN-ACTIVATED PROTEIN KINASE KINASE 7 [Homo sapiens]4UX9_G Chain G, DUAL SPECIFICITY MITOGEN-ACTIVATED PROTEIN KINASE KINASE 7 [Homo sapiens]4UX9_H Chain H, DUAL SPECIFICITY MITOGEN-ACTIVATED PROTEIN KINASE KINASE 7 [Homo sapiens]4UX9_I Chain I, DUAL SPECIFICITY MITOGEN-ACTIVATED PROTEIN KINASE KINASE 7 [Homo sapiens]
QRPRPTLQLPLA